MSKPKAVKPPPPPDPVAVPEESINQEDTAARKARRGMGYQKTLLTGNLAPSKGGASTLG